MIQNKNVVYTCVTGNYESLKFPFKEDGVDYLAFTDDLSINPNGWELVEINSNFKNPIVINRFIKMNPDLFLNNYDKSLYVDGNINIIGPLFNLFDKCLDYPKNFMSIPVHPIRSNLYDEFLSCVNAGKVIGSDAFFLYDEIIKKHPHINKRRLTENSIIFRYHNDSRAKLVGSNWFNNLNNLILRDQLLLDFTLLNLDLDILRLNKNLRGFNSFIYYSPHNYFGLPFAQKIKINIKMSANKLMALFHLFR
jgi:hypothetical protein